MAPLVREAPTTISSFDIAMMSSVVDLVSFVSGGPAQTALKCFGNPGYAGVEFKLIVYWSTSAYLMTQTKHKVGTTSARVSSDYSSEILNDAKLSQARIGMAFAANDGAEWEY